MTYDLKYHFNKKLVSYEYERFTNTVSTPGDCPTMLPDSCSPNTLRVLKKSPVHLIPGHQARLLHLIDVIETSLMTIYLAKNNAPEYIYHCFHRLCVCLGVCDTDIQVQSERLLGLRAPSSPPMLWPPMISKSDIDAYRKNPQPEVVLQTLVELGYSMGLYPKDMMPYLMNHTDTPASPSQRHINPKATQGRVLRFIHHPTPYSEHTAPASFDDTARLSRDLHRYFRARKSLNDTIRLVQATRPSALPDLSGPPLSKETLEDITSIWAQLNIKTLYDAACHKVRSFHVRHADKYDHYSQSVLRLIKPEITHWLRQQFQVGIRDRVITLEMIDEAIMQAFQDDPKIQNGTLKALQASYSFVLRHAKPGLTRRNLLPEFTYSISR